MARFMNTSYNERISDELYQLVREQFEDAQSIYASESGMYYALDFDFDMYIDQFTFSDMVTYLLTH